MTTMKWEISMKGNQSLCLLPEPSHLHQAPHPKANPKIRSLTPSEVVPKTLVRSVGAETNVSRNELAPCITRREKTPHDFIYIMNFIIDWG